MRALAAMALSICTGCLTLIGGDRDHDDVGDDDGDIDAGGGFVLHLPYPPGVELVALKIGDEPWQQVTSEADVAIDTRYAFAYVCPTTVPAGFPPAHRVVVQFLMPYERQAPNPCAPPPSVQLQTVTVGAGTATIDVFAGNMHGRPDANLLVAAPVGIWDVGVVASRFNGANRTLLSIHRDVDLRANTMVVADFTRPSLDLELVTTPFFDFGDSPPTPCVT